MLNLSNDSTVTIGVFGAKDSTWQVGAFMIHARAGIKMPDIVYVDKLNEQSYAIKHNGVDYFVVDSGFLGDVSKNCENPYDVVRVGEDSGENDDGSAEMGDCLNSQTLAAQYAQQAQSWFNQLIQLLAACEPAASCAEKTLNQPTCVTCCAQQQARENKICTYAKGSACYASCQALPAVVPQD